MIDESVRVTRARLRTEIRDLDAQIEKIRATDRMFRRYGFGSDLHEIQLVALQAQRKDAVDALARVGERARMRRASQPGAGYGIGSWLLVPPALVAMALRAIFPRRRRAARPI